MNRLKILSAAMFAIAFIALSLGFAHVARADICSYATGNSPGSACSDPARAAEVDSAGKVANQGYALTCAEAEAQGVISANGFIAALCDSPVPGSSIIETVIQRLVDWISFLGLILFSIMIALAGIQITTAGASPESLKAGKKRITLAVSSIALLLSTNVIFGLIGITGRQFLGVALDQPFTQQTFYQILGNAVGYLQFVGAALAIVFIMIGGVRMMTSVGNPQGIQAARKTITYALIGFAITIGFGFINSLIKLVLTGTP